MITEAYPLQWPAGWPRCLEPKESKFTIGNYRIGFKKHSIDDASSFVVAEVGRMKGASNVIISTNLKYRLDGLPYSKQAQPADQGAAVYFDYNGEQMVIACDSYNKIGCNIYAIGKTIEAMRGIDRWGDSELLKRAFTGFKALPPASGISTKINWWDVLGCGPDADPEFVKQKYRELVNASAEMFIAVKRAYEDAMTRFQLA